MGRLRQHGSCRGQHPDLGLIRYCPVHCCGGHSSNQATAGQRLLEHMIKLYEAGKVSQGRYSGFQIHLGLSPGSGMCCLKLRGVSSWIPRNRKGRCSPRWKARKSPGQRALPSSMFDCLLVDLRQANRYYSYRCSKAWSAIQRGHRRARFNECPGGSARVIEHPIEIRSERARDGEVAASGRLAGARRGSRGPDGLRLLAVSRAGIYRSGVTTKRNCKLRSPSRHRCSHKESAGRLARRPVFG